MRYLIYVILVSICVPMPAFAQGIVGLSPEGPPNFSERELGVNLSTTDVQFQNDDISVGSEEFPTRLTLTRTYNAIGYPFRNLPTINTQNQYTGFGQGSSHSLLSYFTGRRCSTASNSRFISLNAVAFGRSYNFSGGGCIVTGPSTFVSDGDDGAKMRIVDPNQSVWTYELITPEGVRVLFSDQSAYHYDTIGGRYAVAAEFPNGDFIGYTYSNSPSVSGTVRLDSVYNSRGYGLKFAYKTRARYSGANTMTDSSLITSITSYKQTASGTVNLASVNYTYDPTNFVVASFQNTNGGLHRYTYNEGRPTGLFFPRNLTSQPSVSISYFDGSSQVQRSTALSNLQLLGLVGSRNSQGQYLTAAELIAVVNDNEIDVDWSVPNSVTDAVGNVTQFQFSDPAAPDPISVSVTNPDGTVKSYATIFCDTSPACQLPANYTRMPSDFRDENSRDWKYKYDYLGRIMATTNPEGAVNSLMRDANGNITQNLNKAKPGSGAADISSSAGYPPCTASNYKHCNQPIYAIDPRGARWDFQYDSSGGLAVSLAPADANGLRAVTRYSYSDFQYTPVSRPPLLAPAPIRLLTAKDTCLASSVPTNSVDFSYICPPANRVRETYAYAPSTQAAPSSLEQVGVTPDADNNTVSYSFTYDNFGNRTSSKDLNGNTSYVTYDLLRRVVFEIGPDPDGSGSLQRPIVRHVYDDNGNEIRTETGVGSNTNGSDFQILRFVRRTFDLNDQLVRTEDVTP